MFNEELENILSLLYIDPLWRTWISITTVATVVSLWILIIPKWVPNYVQFGFLFGKLTPPNPNKILQLILIPKQWFTHFYGFATLFNAIHLVIVYRLYIFQTPVPAETLILLNLLVPSREVTIDTFAALLAMTLVFIQTSRRLYECLFISVYSNGTINLLQYFVGFLFYFSVTIILLSEAPGFYSIDANWSVHQLPAFDFKWCHFIGLALFLFASVMHYQSHVTLANLRKNKKGVVVTTAHLLPVGFWFEYISCPHYFAEILIYFSLFIILGFKHYGWSLILCWVVSNQVFSGLMTHRWYQEKHKDSYPAKRKAIIPFVL